MLATMQVADIGMRRALRLPLPTPEAVPGLRDARGGVTARLRGSVIPDATPSRAMWLAFWDDEAAFDRYLASDHRLTSWFADAFTVRMEPLQAYGAWPGFPEDLDPQRAERHQGPVVVTTIGLLRMRRSIPWTIASNRVQKQFQQTPGVIWAMGASKPPFFVATMSIWESSEAAEGFAHQPGGAHQKAMEASNAGPFMRQEIFARFAPIATSGRLGPDPAIDESWLADAAERR